VRAWAAMAALGLSFFFCVVFPAAGLVYGSYHSYPLISGLLADPTDDISGKLGGIGNPSVKYIRVSKIDANSDKELFNHLFRPGGISRRGHRGDYHALCNWVACGDAGTKNIFERSSAAPVQCFPLAAHVLNDGVPRKVSRWRLPGIRSNDVNMSGVSAYLFSHIDKINRYLLNFDVSPNLSLPDPPRFFDSILRRSNTLFHPGFLANNPVKFETSKNGQSTAENGQPKRVIREALIGVNLLGFAFGDFLAGCYGVFLWWRNR
jgi:hypothetical protein